MLMGGKKAIKDIVQSSPPDKQIFISILINKQSKEAYKECLSEKKKTKKKWLQLQPLFK